MRKATCRRCAALLLLVSVLFSGCRWDNEKPVPDNTDPTSSVSTTVTTTTPTTTTEYRHYTTVPAPSAFRLQQVPQMAQFPLYPTGCESVSAVMALRYVGGPITVEEFVERHLAKDTNFYYDEQYYYGPDPRLVFAGDPRTTSSYGCMAPVIERAMIHYLGADERVVNATGATMEELCSRYVAQGIPVCVWVSVNMLAIIPTDTWITPAGETYTWPGNEHCMLLIGYDEERYYFNDPYKGREVSYSRTLAEARYETMGRQAIAVLP